MGWYDSAGNFVMTNIAKFLQKYTTDQKIDVYYKFKNKQVCTKIGKQNVGMGMGVSVCPCFKNSQQNYTIVLK